MSNTLYLQDIVESVYKKYLGVDEGAVATYIPELGKADPNDFALCVVTVEGQVFSAGNCQKEFTIQSICKPFAFQLALEEFGPGGNASQGRGRAKRRRV